MVEKFHAELRELKKEVIKMGYLSKEMLMTSVEALKDQDEEKIKWVLERKGKISDIDTEIEAKALQMIALYQPMAQDMRKIGVIIKIITYLHRIGRYGKDIANVASELTDKPHVKKLVSLPYMAKIVDDMITDSLTAFEEENIDKLSDFDDRDDSVDELRYSIFRECLSYMMEDSKVISRCTHYIMVARYLERCADHACKIGEKVHYMVTGKHIEIDCSENKKSRYCRVK